jgi:uncharacterized protein
MNAGVVVFGRQPRPGRVKTRLAEELGGTAAARVYEVLLGHTLREAVATGMPVTLALAEPAAHDWEPPLPVALELQPEGDLGTRMAASFAGQFVRGVEIVVLVGTDVPRLDRRRLSEAAARCARHAVVLGPASDGGYYLVAQRRPGVDMFGGIPWSSAATLEATRSRLRSLAARWCEVETLDDVDDGPALRAALADPELPPDLVQRLRSVVSAAEEGRW